MMVDLKVMAYFKLSLSTHNWDRALGKSWERQNIWLAAHWVSTGKPIDLKEGKQPVFQLTIPFTEEAMAPLLTKVSKMDFFTEEKLATLSSYSKAEAAKLRKS
ncbi:hypothetical protein [Aeromonas salmonicida]|uniref:hypothetical protein n=1 Tax=Aeromonas salmonicida TaxID=645 RepID=UPI002240792E|nr:hypothetical protein [Aeromonas salmonicida]